MGPFQLLDADGVLVEPVAVFFAGLQAEEKSVSTLRAYGNDLLLWWRWLAAVGVAWNHVTTIEGRDFLRWMRIADKPTRVHWRYRDGASPPASDEKPGTVKRASAGANPVTGRQGLASSTRPRPGRAPSRPCAPSMTSTWRLARVPSSTRSRWTGRGVRAGPTPTTIRWTSSSVGGRVVTGPKFRSGSATSSSTRSSPG
ncbi:site-specific integrase [Acrocarpospora corrugata]|uniref:site-specific integrase n=1 Tax=Acrocarpospora corrugata TaxID=35763 RepID=UPI001C3F6496